jgi:drug/metabolite transporter (DMT)-like permease
MEKPKAITIAIAYFIVVLIWSTTPLAIKWSAEGVGFMFAVTARMLIGSTLALLLVLLWYRRLPLHGKALQVYAIAGIAIFGAMTAVYWGAQYISSGLVSVIFGMTPIITAWLAARFLYEQSMTGFKIVGAVSGIGGLAVIFSEQLHLGDQASIGILAVLLSVLLHSISSVGIKRVDAKLPALVVTAGGLLASLPFFVLVFWLLPESLPGSFPSRAIWAIVYLGVMGSVVGFVSYYFVLQNLAASTVALITLLTPVTALWLGHFFNQEVLSVYIWTGTALVLTGLAIHQWGSMLVRVYIKKST